MPIYGAQNTAVVTGCPNGYRFSYTVLWSRIKEASLISVHFNICFQIPNEKTKYSALNGERHSQNLV
jgi:hypothetical protein